MGAHQSILPLYGDVPFDLRLLFQTEATRPKPFYTSTRGALFGVDCMKVLPQLRESIVDTVFADPPFNLGKAYGKSTNDSIDDEEYVEWCKRWLEQCVRVLKPGGSLFLYNLPKWNVLLGAFLASELELTFRHWIAVESSTGMPIPGRLYPCHYSLLYLSKGRPNKFYKIRTPIQTCRHCDGEIKDYGGHRHAMNIRGVSLKDVWNDIPPVRHWKFKSKARRANALSTKILDRVLEMSTDPGDLVLDPFGGSGTTYVVCEYKDRKWLGMEIDFAQEIVDRISTDSIKSHTNSDFVER